MSPAMMDEKTLLIVEDDRPLRERLARARSVGQQKYAAKRSGFASGAGGANPINGRVRARGRATKIGMA